MGYKIGQLTNNAFNPSDYSTSLIEDITPTTVITPKKYDLQGSQNNQFTDNCITGTFAANAVYSLQIKIKIPTDTDTYPNGIEINVLLADNDNNTIQTIDRLTVPNSNDSMGQIYYSNTLFFVPIKQGNKIIFEMVRGQQDYFKENGARQWLTETGNFSVEKFQQLNNINKNNNKWKRIGFQSRPGSKIVINKVPITVGRSGIFELNVGIDITEFMVVENSAGQIDPFILDYTYITS